MEEIQFPFAMDIDWALPPVPRPNGLKSVSDRKLCLHAILGQTSLGDYACFEGDTARAGYYGRLELDVPHGNYIELAAQIAGTEPFADGTPYLPFDRLPQPVRALFAAGGRLFWSHAYSVSLSRQWNRLHAETHLRPGDSPVQRTVSQAEGVALSRFEIAGRIATWERLRDAAQDVEGSHLLGLDELGLDLDQMFRQAEMNATGHSNAERHAVELHVARSNTFDRGFAAPVTARGPVDETYNQLRETIGFHQTWFLSSVPFDLNQGIAQSGVYALTLPLYAGATGESEIVNDTDVFEVRHFAQA